MNVAVRRQVQVGPREPRDFELREGEAVVAMAEALRMMQHALPFALFPSPWSRATSRRRVSSQARPRSIEQGLASFGVPLAHLQRAAGHGETLVL